jgi:hypothetical protein
MIGNKENVSMINDLNLKVWRRRKEIYQVIQVYLGAAFGRVV